MRYRILDIPIDNLTFNAVVQKIVEKIENYDNEPCYIVTPNVDHVLKLRKDSFFRLIYDNSFLSVPDGVPLLWVSRLFKKPLPERVNGTDLFEKLCEIAAEKKFKVFLLGGRPGAAEKAVEVLRNRYSNIDCSYYCPPYGFEYMQNEMQKISNIISTYKPHILFVGLGAPKQEKWIYWNYKRLNVPISIGVGCSFEFVSGMIKRAPKWMQKFGLEWLYRFIKEPIRLGKRYLIGNLMFIIIVLFVFIGDKIFHKEEI